MSSYFQPRATGDSWFRIGRVEVTSTVAVVMLAVVALLVSAIVPQLPVTLAYVPDLAWGGQWWRVLTWPLANVISIWTAITLFMLWYFGGYIEAQLGRVPMAWFYVKIWASFTCAASVVRPIGPTILAGLLLVQLAMLLLWVAQYPNARFFFNIPAWAFGAFIVAMQALQLIAMRDFSSLLMLLLGLALIACFARCLGLLGSYPWLPKLPLFQAKKTSPSKQHKTRQQAEHRIDQLLDKINAEGIHSLTKKERAELDRLRKQRRG